MVFNMFFEKRYHGGGIENVIDFSVNTNPLGIPEFLQELIEDCIRRKIYENYPDSNYLSLRQAISNFYAIDWGYIIPTNGASEGLTLTILALKPRYLITVEPSYGDYEYTCKALTIDYIRFLMNDLGSKFQLDLQLLQDVVRKLNNCLIIIVNPNNPTGIFVNYDELINFANEVKHCYLLIDEVYVEFTKHNSILKYCSELPDNVIIVKSFTKILSIPGLRIGFVYTKNLEIAKLIEYCRPTWNINSISNYIVTKCLTDFENEFRNFIEITRQFVENERMFIISKLNELNLIPYESCTNFILVKGNFNSINLMNYLLHKYRILIRSCHNFYGLSSNYIRISIKTRELNNYLINALKDYLQNSA